MTKPTAERGNVGVLAEPDLTLHLCAAGSLGKCGHRNNPVQVTGKRNHTERSSIAQELLGVYSLQISICESWTCPLAIKAQNLGSIFISSSSGLWVLSVKSCKSLCPRSLSFIPPQYVCSNPLSSGTLLLAVSIVRVSIWSLQSPPYAYLLKSLFLCSKIIRFFLTVKLHILAFKSPSII